MASPWMNLLGKLSRTPRDGNTTTLPIPPSRPVRRKMAARGYHTASTVGRLNYGQRSVGVGPNSVTSADLASLRARSRGADRNSGTFRKAKHAMVNALVGKGIRPQSNTGDEKLDAAVDALWARFVPVADADDRGDAYWLQRQAVGSWVVSGEVFLRRRSRSMSDGIPIPVEIQALESDMLPLTDITPTGSAIPDGAYVNQGIVFDALGKRTSYIMYRQHPADLIADFSSFSSAETVRVPAADISHVYDADRPGQARGLPWGSCVLEDMVALDEYLYNEAVRQETQSNMAAFITGADPELNQGLGDVEQDAETLDYIDTLNPGMVRHLAHGETIDFAVPQVSPGLKDYASVQYHKIAAGWGLSYAQLTGDLTSVNFSSGRMGHLDAAEMQGNLQAHLVIPHVCQPQWRWFIQGAIATGTLPDRAEGYPVIWTPPRTIPIDRKKEAEADILEIDNNLSAPGDIIRGRGQDPFAVWARAAADKKEMERLGLSTPAMDANPAPAPAVQDDTEEDDDASTVPPVE
jgi:lambda family phage portal protein